MARTCSKSFPSRSAFRRAGRAGAVLGQRQGGKPGARTQCPRLRRPPPLRRYLHLGVRFRISMTSSGVIDRARAKSSMEREREREEGERSASCLFFLHSSFSPLLLPSFLRGDVLFPSPGSCLGFGWEGRCGVQSAAPLPLFLRVCDAVEEGELRAPYLRCRVLEKTN